MTPGLAGADSAFGLRYGLLASLRMVSFTAIIAATAGSAITEEFISGQPCLLAFFLLLFNQSFQSFERFMTGCAFELDNFLTFTTARAGCWVLQL